MSTLGKRRGFTFLELMLALAIVSIMAAAVVASWMAADRARRSVMNAVEPLRQGTTALDFMKRDFESTLPVTGYLSWRFWGGQSTDVQTASYIQFCAAIDSPPDASMQSDIHQIAYTLIADGNTYNLVRYVASNLLVPDGSDPVPELQEVLCRGVRTFTVEYYDGTDWTTTWDSTQEASAMGSQQSQLIPVALHVILELDPVTENGAPIQLERYFYLPCTAPATQPAGGL